MIAGAASPDVGIHLIGGSRMGEPLRFPEDPENQSDGRCKGRLAAAETVDSIIGLTDTLGACIEGVLSGLWRLEEISQGLDNLVARLPAGERRQQIEHQQALAKEQLVIVRKLLAGC
jgi:hypothetical protein